MRKKFLLIIPLIIFSLFFMNITSAFAVANDIDMNISSNSTNTAGEDSSTDTYTPSSQTTYSSSNSNELNISNILNILLIVIGILLILLSIAILVRLKH